MNNFIIVTIKIMLEYFRSIVVRWVCPTVSDCDNHWHGLRFFPMFFTKLLNKMLTVQITNKLKCIGVSHRQYFINQFIVSFSVFIRFVDTKINKEYYQRYPSNNMKLLPSAILPLPSRPQTLPPLCDRGQTRAPSTLPGGSGRYTQWIGRRRE